MPSVAVKVKWLKNKYDVEIDLDEPAELFMTQLFALTGVPPDRQKITAGAKQIKDGTDLKTIGLKDQQMLMLFGAADEALAKPTEMPEFFEDVAPGDMAAVMAAGIPFGLANLGNTCYMNSTLQVLKNADDFAEAVKAAPGVSDPLVRETQAVFKKMESATAPIEPTLFWERLKQRKPEFAQQTNQGGWMQQDAEECLTELLNCVNNVVKTPSGKGIVDDNFAIEIETETTLDEAEGGSEEPTKRTEKFYKLSCHIQGQTKQADGSFKGATDLMPQGIAKGLEDKLEKTSPSLGRMAIYNTKSRVTRLPKFLVTQLVRFYYKTDTQKKAKVLRPVKFPFMLDVYDFCAPELQAKIKGYRDKKVAKQREEEAEAKKAKLSHETPAAAGGAAAAGGDSAGGEAESKMQVEAEAGPAESMVIEEDDSCYATYQLTGVLTHKGTDADGGHYVAWIRKDDGTWYLFDDHKVSETTPDKIKNLSGQSAMDHMAYMCLYKRTPLVFGSDNTRYEEEKSGKDKKKGMK